MNFSVAFVEDYDGDDDGAAYSRYTHANGRSTTSSFHLELLQPDALAHAQRPLAIETRPQPRWLPTEILALIFQHLGGRIYPLNGTFPSRSVEQTIALAACCLASRTFYAVATPFLYRDLDFSIPEPADDDRWLRVELLRWALKSRPQLQAHVRSLTLRYSDFEGSEWWDLGLRRLTPMLEELNLVDDDGDSLAWLTVELLFCSAIKNLRYLSVSSKNPVDWCEEDFLAQAFSLLSRLQGLALGGSIGDEVGAQRVLQLGTFPLKELDLEFSSVSALLSLPGAVHSLRRLNLTIPCYHTYREYRDFAPFDTSINISIFSHLEDVHISLAAAPEMEQLVGQLGSCANLKTLRLSDATIMGACPCSPSPDDYLQIGLTRLPVTISKLDVSLATLPPAVLVEILEDSRFDGVDVELPRACGSEVEIASRARWWRRVERGGDFGPKSRSALNSLLYDSDAEQEVAGVSGGKRVNSAFESGAVESSSEWDSEEEPDSPTLSLWSSDEEDPDFTLKPEYIAIRRPRHLRRSHTSFVPSQRSRPLVKHVTDALRHLNISPSTRDTATNSVDSSDEEEEEEEMYEEGEVEDGWAAFGDERSSAMSSEKED